MQARRRGMMTGRLKGRAEPIPGFGALAHPAEPGTIKIEYLVNTIVTLSITICAHTALFGPKRASARCTLFARGGLICRLRRSPANKGVGGALHIGGRT